jgi:hypothetical protein
LCEGVKKKFYKNHCAYAKRLENVWCPYSKLNKDSTYIKIMAKSYLFRGNPISFGETFPEIEEIKIVEESLKK